MKIVRRLVKIALVICTAVSVFAFFQERLSSVSREKKVGLYEKYFKRPLDAFLATAGLIILSPLIILTTILVRIKIGHPVLFTQDRPGKIERVFKLYKFRTMTDAKDENGRLLPDTQRLTPFGAKLRSTSLDELPELLNIIKGDMAIIGPRPLLVQYLPYYTDREKHRHDVRPGLSGLAQVNGRNLVKWDQRLAYDVQYVNNITFLGDLKIVLETIKKVIKRDDVVVNTDLVETYLDAERSGEE